MSASERLEALEADLTRWTNGYDSVAPALVGVLSQIVAVVEAAEWAESVLVAPMPEGWGSEERDLRAALAALDEELEHVSLEMK